MLLLKWPLSSFARFFLGFSIIFPAQAMSQIFIDYNEKNHSNYVVTDNIQIVDGKEVPFRTIQIKNQSDLLETFKLKSGLDFDRTVFVISASNVELDCENKTIHGYQATRPYGLRGSLLDTTSVKAMAGIVIENNFVRPLQNVKVKNCNFNNITQYGIRVRLGEYSINYKNLLKTLNQAERKIELPISTEVSTPSDFIKKAKKVLNFAKKKNGINNIQLQNLSELLVLEKSKSCLKFIKRGNSDFERASEYQGNDIYSVSETPYSCLAKFKMNNVVIENVTIDNSKSIDTSNCINLAVGVHGVILDTIKLKGCRGGVYFSPNSADNQIKNSVFDNTQYFNKYRTEKFMVNGRLKGIDELRESVSIDSAQRNIIGPNNHFLSQRAGVLLYKNCWENYFDPQKPEAKFSRPRIFGSDNNQIIQNTFEDVSYGIWVASRQSTIQRECGDQYVIETKSAGPVGLVKDIASFNLIKNNTFKLTQFSIQKMASNIFLTKDLLFNPSLPAYGHLSALIIEGSKATVDGNTFEGSWVNTVLIGDYSKHSKRRPDILNNSLVLNDGCSVDSNNSGCSKIIECPKFVGPKKLVIDNARVICNLETSASIIDILNLKPFASEMEVGRESQNVSEGQCLVENKIIQSGRSSIDLIFPLKRFKVGCSEYDFNGGDCNISAQIICKQP